MPKNDHIYYLKVDPIFFLQMAPTLITFLILLSFNLLSNAYGISIDPHSIDKELHFNHDNKKNVWGFEEPIRITKEYSILPNQATILKINQKPFKIHQQKKHLLKHIIQHILKAEKTATKMEKKMFTLFKENKNINKTSEIIKNQMVEKMAKRRWLPQVSKQTKSNNGKDEDGKGLWGKRSYLNFGQRIYGL